MSSDAANRIDGRGGSDTVSYDLSARGQLINLAGEAATDGIVTDTFSSIENAIGTQFADRIVAGADANRLEGRGGNDTFVFQRGQANGDTVVDFNGNGRAPATPSSSSATAPARRSFRSTRCTGRSTPATA